MQTFTLNRSALKQVLESVCVKLVAKVRQQQRLLSNLPRQQKRARIYLAPFCRVFCYCLTSIRVVPQQADDLIGFSFGVVPDIPDWQADFCFQFND